MRQRGALALDLILAATVIAAVVGLLLGGLHYAYRAGRAAGVQATMVRWAAENSRQAEASRLEEQRREAAQKASLDEYESRVQAARADADRAHDAADRLRQRAEALASIAGQSAGHPAADGPGPAAANPAGVLADVLGRCVDAYRRMAAIADQRGESGAACERAYDALTSEGAVQQPSDLGGPDNANSADPLPLQGGAIGVEPGGAGLKVPRRDRLRLGDG